MLMRATLSMPTFLVVKNGSVAKTIRGADASALRSAITAAAADAAKGSGASGAAFRSKGQVLGDGDAKASRPARGGRGGGGGGGAGLSLLSGSPAVDDVLRFVALYFTTLLSFDSSAAAAASPFSRAAR